MNEYEGYNTTLPNTDSEHVLIQKIVLIQLKNKIKYKEVVSNKEMSVKVFMMPLVNDSRKQIEILENLINIISKKKFYEEIIIEENTNDLKEYVKVIINNIGRIILKSHIKTCILNFLKDEDSKIIEDFEK